MLRETFPGFGGGFDPLAYYTLLGHEPKRVSRDEFFEWMMTCPDRHVADDMIGDVRVSTMFLGVVPREGYPLFETMVFGGILHETQVRYSTWAEAEKGHAIVRAQVIAERAGR